jgi:hypothetical protein
MSRSRGAVFALVFLACGAQATHVVTTHEPKPAPEIPLEGGACAHVEIPEAEQPWSSAYAVDESPDGDLCAVSTKNLRRSEAAALEAVRRAGASPAFTAWDHTTKPARLDLVQSRLGLTTAQTDALMKRGFVVLDSPSFGSYTEAFHEIYQSELPLWVSVDAILHAVYKSNDKLLARIERASIMPALNRALDAMHCALPAAASKYPNPTARDVDLYLTVARSLLAGKPVASVFGVDAEAAKIVERANAAAGIEDLEIFGRSRVVDFSAYQPRGHYAAASPPETGNDPNAGDGASLTTYFRAATWLSRFEFNLATYDCSSSSKGVHEQTPREDLAALALADLMNAASATADVAKLDAVWGALAGKREDLSFAEVAKLAARGQLNDLHAPDAATKFRALVGHNYTRTARTHFTWEGCGDLPAISTMLGARIVPDSAVTRPLVHSEIPDRQLLGAMDMAYAFGQDRAKTYLATDLAKYPKLASGLEAARKTARAPLTGGDLYSAWFGAVRGLSDAPNGTLPSFMRTDAFADLRLSSTVAAFGQIRHNYVLMAAMTYGEAGCEIPDAFVEPAPATYAGLIEYAHRGEQAMNLLDPKSDDTVYFQRLADLLELLSAIGNRELENRPLPDEAQRFLSMVVEATFGWRSTGSSPTFTGWYFDMFHERNEAMEGASFIADYYTSTELGVAAYAGVKGVKLGVFVVDSAGAPRVVVGPVSDSFEAHEKLPRLDDAHVSSAKAEAPWAASYVVAGAAEPPLAIAAKKTSKDGFRDSIAMTVTSTRALGKVTIDLLDHHRRSVQTVTHDVGRGAAVFTFAGARLKKDETIGDGIEGFHVKVGDWQTWVTGELGPQFGAPPIFVVDRVGRAWGGMKSPPNESVEQPSPGN